MCLLSSSCDAAFPFLRRFTSFSLSNSNSEVDDEVTDDLVSSTRRTSAVMRQAMMPSMSAMILEDDDMTMMVSMSPMAAMDGMNMMSPMPSSAPMIITDEEDMMMPAMSPDMMIPDVSASPDDDDDEICVDVKYLATKGFTSSQHFVHRQHFKANVLCPMSNGLPCGTANHAIRINGKGNEVKKITSYKTFCSVYKCERKRMLVNSVWSHIWNENEHGVIDESQENENMKLTMFDQRHPQSMQLALHRIMATTRRVFG